MASFVLSNKRGRITRPRKLVKLLSLFYATKIDRAAKLINLARRVSDEEECIEARVLITYCWHHRADPHGRHNVGSAFRLLHS